MARVHHSSEPYRAYDKTNEPLQGLFRSELEESREGQPQRPQSYHCAMCGHTSDDPDGQMRCVNPDCEDFETLEDVEFRRSMNAIQQAIEEEPFIEDER